MSNEQPKHLPLMMFSSEKGPYHPARRDLHELCLGLLYKSLAAKIDVEYTRQRQRRFADGNMLTFQLNRLTLGSYFDALTDGKTSNEEIIANVSKALEAQGITDINVNITKRKSGERFNYTLTVLVIRNRTVYDVRFAVGNVHRCPHSTEYILQGDLKKGSFVKMQMADNGVKLVRGGVILVEGIKVHSVLHADQVVLDYAGEIQAGDELTVSHVMEIPR